MSETLTIDTTLPARQRSSAVLIAILAALSSSGTLATNILLPSLPDIATSLNITSAAVTSAITVFLTVFAVGQLVVGPLSDRYGRRLPVLIGFAVFVVGSAWCAVANDLSTLLAGRVVQAAGACATSVLARAVARDLFEGAALGRVMAFIMIAMAAAPGFSPLLGGVLNVWYGWRSGFVFVAFFGAVAALAFAWRVGETHHATRSPIDLRSIAAGYIGLASDRRFAVPAATVSLVLGGLFAMFASTPRVLIEGLNFTPIQLGLFFAGTVLVVFSAGMSATKLTPRIGLDRAITIGLMLASLGGVTVLMVAMFDGRFLPLLIGVCVFLLGMGIVNPLGTAQTLSPFGDRAGAASALLGFWQMMGAAGGVWLAANVTRDAMLGLGIVLTVGAIAGAALYALRRRTDA